MLRRISRIAGRRLRGSTNPEVRPMPSDSLPLSDLQEIDRLCDSFEAAWQAGLKPRIEQYLNATTLEERTHLFRELLGARWSCGGSPGRSPSRRTTSSDLRRMTA